MKAVVLIALLAFSLCAYDGSKAKAYADQWWSSANHKCGNYLNCSPYAYFGNEVCGYESHGGDCANFVSQCLLAGGHSALKGGDCRGYPCGKEEPGATRLGRCLKSNFGWTRTCGHKQTPPSNLKVGDVIVYHSGSCKLYIFNSFIIIRR